MQPKKTLVNNSMATGSVSISVKRYSLLHIIKELVAKHRRRNQTRDRIQLATLVNAHR